LFCSIRFSRGVSTAETVVVPRRFRFRFVLLLVSMCCLNALLRTIFPEAVRLNRFAAPRCVFNFGMELGLSLDEVLYFLRQLFLSAPLPGVRCDRIVCIVLPSRRGMVSCVA